MWAGAAPDESGLNVANSMPDAATRSAARVVRYGVQLAMRAAPVQVRSEPVDLFRSKPVEFIQAVGAIRT
jgi:hypothetical protein